MVNTAIQLVDYADRLYSAYERISGSDFVQAATGYIQNNYASGARRYMRQNYPKLYNKTAKFVRRIGRRHTLQLAGPRSSSRSMPYYRSYRRGGYRRRRPYRRRYRRYRPRRRVYRRRPRRYRRFAGRVYRRRRGYRPRRRSHRAHYPASIYRRAILSKAAAIVRPPFGRQAFRRYRFSDVHVSKVNFFHHNVASDPLVYPGSVHVHTTYPWNWFGHSTAYNASVDAVITPARLAEVNEYKKAAVEACRVRITMTRIGKETDSLADPYFIGWYASDGTDENLPSPTTPSFTGKWSHEYLIMDKSLHATMIQPGMTGVENGAPERDISITKTIKPVNWTKDKKRIIDNPELEFDWNEGVPNVVPSKQVRFYVWRMPAFNDTDIDSVSRTDTYHCTAEISWDILLYGRRTPRTHEVLTAGEALGADRHPPTANV